MSEKPLPNYEVVPLRSDEITISIVQSPAKMVDIDDAKTGKQRNLKHLLKLIDLAGPKTRADLIVFHEYPISGALDPSWHRKKIIQDVAIDVPGEETFLIGQKAKQYNCYIELGCYARQDDWPNHFINMGVIIDPQGEVIYKHWKLRNTPGLGFSTTVYDVLDEYVIKYGWDAVFPIAKTNIGNISIAPCVKEPELIRAAALKGAEIVIRYMADGGGHYSTSPSLLRGGGNHTFGIDLQAACIQNNIYGVFVNNALSLQDDVIFDSGAGYSSIYDPDGNIIAQASSPHESIISVAIPVATYRTKHSIPVYFKELLKNINEEYVPKYPANSFIKYLPDTKIEAKKHYKDLARW
jgi:predicted amidohydrolase